MPLYQYTAMDSNGKEQKGKKEAGSEEEVATFLKNQGLFPTSIKSATKGGGGKGGKGGDALRLRPCHIEKITKELSAYASCR